MITLTMEETFVTTYIFTFLVGIGLGYLTYLVFEKDNKENEND